MLGLDPAVVGGVNRLEPDLRVGAHVNQGPGVVASPIIGRREDGHELPAGKEFKPFGYHLVCPDDHVQAVSRTKPLDGVRPKFHADPTGHICVNTGVGGKAGKRVKQEKKERKGKK